MDDKIIEVLKNNDVEALMKICIKYNWTGDVNFDKIYESIKEIDNPSVHNFIGFIYRDGYGSFEKNITKALNFFESAAKHNDVLALNNLGHMYYYGKGVENDYSKALYYYQLSAEQGVASSQYSLGNMYYYGIGEVKKDYLKAFYYYQLSAEQGLANSQNSLGNMYYYGKGVDKDYFKAHYYWRLAADQNNYPAKINITDLIYGNRNICKLFFKDLISTKKQLKELEEENERLKEENTELKYRPPTVGGIGYMEAKTEFETLSSNV
jgi:TPR repeat protein